MSIAYKLFRTKKNDPGKLFPLYVLADKEVPIGIWLEAEEGERLPDGRVKSKIGPLAFRPGWHMSDIPLAIHIGLKENGVIKYMNPSHVWCECEYSDEVSYREKAYQNGLTDKGFKHWNACLREVPVNGYYRYKTNPNQLGEWIIAGRMKVNRILSDEEVAILCRNAGYEPMPRKPEERA